MLHMLRRRIVSLLNAAHDIEMSINIVAMEILLHNNLSNVIA